MSDRAPPKGFAPRGGIQKELGARYEKDAALAHRQPMKAIKLKCLDCCAWDYAEAQQCEIRSCPLWALNLRIFGR